MKSPRPSNSIAHCTTVSGYHSGSPGGDDEIMVHGAASRQVAKVPTGVGAVGLPVVAGAALTAQPSA
jgi:hypothetical protein